MLQLEYESSRDPYPDPRHIGLDKPGRSRATTIVTSFTSRGCLSPAERAQAEEIILSLWQKRNDKERHTIAVRRIRARYMRWLSASLVGGVVLLSLLLYLVSIRPTELWLELAAVAVAGALGGTLGGTFRVRDSLEKIAELKESWPAVVAQPFVGATAGLIVFALFAANVVKIAGLEVTPESGSYAWAPLTVVAFAAGFSERFFLRNVDLVQRGRSSSESPE